jgi:hypothetical protein
VCRFINWAILIGDSDPCLTLENLKESLKVSQVPKAGGKCTICFLDLGFKWRKNKIYARIQIEKKKKT